MRGLEWNYYAGQVYKHNAIVIMGKFKRANECDDISDLFVVSRCETIGSD